MFSFQFNGEHLFHWHDREGNEKTLEIQDSLCNLKSNVLRTDHAQIRDKSHLPISKLLYGPHQLETEQMTITVSELVCPQDSLENFMEHSYKGTWFDYYTCTRLQNIKNNREQAAKSCDESSVIL